MYLNEIKDMLPPPPSLFLSVFIVDPPLAPGNKEQRPNQKIYIDIFLMFYFCWYLCLICGFDLFYQILFENFESASCQLKVLGQRSVSKNSKDAEKVFKDFKIF